MYFKIYVIPFFAKLDCKQFFFLFYIFLYKYHFSGFFNE